MHVQNVRVRVPVGNVVETDRGTGDRGRIDRDVIDPPRVNHVVIEIIQVRGRGLPAEGRDGSTGVIWGRKPCDDAEKGERTANGVLV